LGIDETVNAAGICGSIAAGLLRSAPGGAQFDPLGSGWAAQNGIAAAFLAWAGNTGPAEIFEECLGFIAPYWQGSAAQFDLRRLDESLDSRWESRNSLFRPYPAAEVIQPYIRALLRLRAQTGAVPEDVERMECAVAPSLVPIIVEPREERCAPASLSQARTSLPYSVAEAFYRNSSGSDAYNENSLRNPAILNLARRVNCYAEASFTSSASLKGSVRILLKDGRVLEEKQEYTGAIENAMTEDEVLARFHENTRILPRAAREQLAELMLNLEQQPDASALIPLTAAREAC
jgi:2-methylcitrate dehydratase PrpD